MNVKQQTVKEFKPGELVSVDIRAAELWFNRFVLQEDDNYSNWGAKNHCELSIPASWLKVSPCKLWITLPCYVGRLMLRICILPVNIFYTLHIFWLSSVSLLKPSLFIYIGQSFPARCQEIKHRKDSAVKIYIFIDKLEFVIEAGLCHQSLLMNGETAVPGMATVGCLHV